MTRPARVPFYLAATATVCLGLLGACTTDESSPYSKMPTGSQIERQPLTSQEVGTADDTLQNTAVSLTRPVMQMSEAHNLQPSRRVKMADASRSLVGYYPSPPQVNANEKYEALPNNEVLRTEDQSVSTFSIDVDTGSYSNVRRFLQHGSLPPADAVRVEEMLNYFSYDYPLEASADKPFSVITELGTTPWNTRTRLLHIGLQGFVPPVTDAVAANLVFLIDVSGSMHSPDKLGLLKSSISMLSNELTEKDTVSMVVYAGSSGVALPPTAGNQQGTIQRALSALQAGGSTHGAQGIELAYQLASDNLIKGGINRVILATDGDFNVGISDVKQLKKLIARKRESGIALTTLGFGTGNYNDHLMEQLADTGNGNYAYIDTLAEARKVLVEERHATMMRIANDVKIQVEFNPARVSEYRLIGYTNRVLANEDFNDDTVDAGDIGAGHTVTALYEIALRGEGGERNTPLRYQRPDASAVSEYSDELAEIRLRYKLPGQSTSRLISQRLRDEQLIAEPAQTSDNFRFSASVAALGQLLRANSRIEAFGYEDIREMARLSLGDDIYGYRAEFIRLVDMATSLDRMQRASNGALPRDEG